MYHVYILRCADKSLYTGICVDLAKRIMEHNSSVLGAKYTRSRRPVKLIFSQRFKNRSTASRREAAIKKLSRIEKLSLIRKHKLR